MEKTVAFYCCVVWGLHRRTPLCPDNDPAVEHRNALTLDALGSWV